MGDTRGPCWFRHILTVSHVLSETSPALADLRISIYDCPVSVHLQPHSSHTEISCTSEPLSASWAANVLSNGLRGLTDRPRSPRAAGPMLGEQGESIKVTGWIRAGTPHYLLGGTPISSNWFDKCSSIHRMRDEGRDREPGRMTERESYIIRFVIIRSLFPVTATCDSTLTTSPPWTQTKISFEQELIHLIVFAAYKHIQNTHRKEMSFLFGVHIKCQLLYYNIEVTTSKLLKCLKDTVGTF